LIATQPCDDITRELVHELFVAKILPGDTPLFPRLHALSISAER